MALLDFLDLNAMADTYAGEMASAIAPQIIAGRDAAENREFDQEMNLAKLADYDRKALNDAFDFQKKRRQSALDDILLAQKVNIPEPVPSDEDYAQAKAEVLGDATEATPDQLKQIDARVRQITRSKVPAFDPNNQDTWMNYATENMVSDFTKDRIQQSEQLEMQKARLDAQDARFYAGQEQLLKRLGITLKESARRQEDAQSFNAGQKAIDRSEKRLALREQKAQKLIQELNKSKGAYFNFDNPNFEKGRKKLLDTAKALKALDAPDSWRQFQGDYGNKLKAMISKEKAVQGGKRKPQSELERYDQRAAEREAANDEAEVQSSNNREKAELLLLEDQAKVANGAFLSRRDAARLDELRAKHGKVQGPKSYVPGKKYKDGEQFLFQGQLMKVQGGRAIPVR